MVRSSSHEADQLERFYLSHADPAMKVGNLHSLKPQLVVEEIESLEKPRDAIQIRASLNEPLTSAFA